MRMGTDPFVDQLAGLCRAEPTRAKWVFVSSHAMGLTLGERLARDGCDWANLRFVTPLDIAVRMAAPFLLERGLNPSEEPLGPALIMRLLLDLSGEGGYFRPMAQHPSMADALWQTVRELRYAGVRAADLPASAFASAAKHTELVALLTAYERHLEAQHIADMPTVLQEAVKHLDWCPIAPDDVVTEIPDTLWSPLVREFLDTLPGRRLRARTNDTPDVLVPARAGRLAAPVERVATASTSGASRLRFLQSPKAAPKGRPDGSLDLFHAGGRDAEVEEVLRRILGLGEPLDRSEIVCASGDYVPLVWEKAQRLGWRATSSAGIPAVMTGPGRLLLRYCEWVGGGFTSADLRRLLQSGDCEPMAFEGASAGTPGPADTKPAGPAAPAPDSADGALTPGQAARLLLRARTTWGRANYAASLATLAARYRTEAAYVDTSPEERQWKHRKAAQTRTLAAWIDGLLTAVPVPDEEDRVSLGAVAGAAIAFLRTDARRASAIDAAAAAALVSGLSDLLHALGDHRCDLVCALGFVRAGIESLAIGRDRPRPGALHISSVNDGGYDGRPHVFIVGLQEDGVFPPAVEDAVLLDSERRQITSLLRTAVDQLDEAVFGTIGRLAAIGAPAATVCLSFSCRDTRQFRGSFPSWIVLQAFRLMKGDASLSYGALDEWLAEPASAVPASPGAALTDAGWWLAGAARTSAARGPVLTAFPPLNAGIRAEEARASDEFTSYDGYVPAAGPVLDSTRNGRGSSATTLEAAAACPFRHFLKAGLGVRPIEVGMRDEDAWLDALTKGAELHALYARFMRALREERRRPAVKRDLDRLRVWGQARLGQLEAEMPPPSDEVRARESREFLEDLDAFLIAECDGRHGGDPLGFEVAFGIPLAEAEGEPLASADPLVLDLGGERRLVLHGWIDRINRLGPGEYEVVDYKTGRYWADSWKGSFAGGTRLQHAIYGAAAAPLLRTIDPKARVVQGRYLFPAVKGYGRSKRIPAPSTAALVEVLRDLSDTIGAGAFLSADDGDACAWCEFAAACHPGAVDATKRKLENGENTALDPYRRLRSHE